MRRPLLAILLLAACGRDPAPSEPPAAQAAPQAPADHRRQAQTVSTRAREPDWGEPDMDEVARLFRRRFPEVKRCYEAALARDPAVRGKLTLRFTIAPGGALEDVSFASSTFRRRDVPDCVADVVRRWRTPFRPAEPVAVEYPLRFSPR